MTKCDEVTPMKKAHLSIKVDPEYRDQIEKKAKLEGLTISAYVRHCLDYHQEKCDQSNTEHDANNTESHQDPTFLMEQINIKDQQLSTKDGQIEKLQSALDQSQQLQAMTESRYQAEHQQLIEMKARSFWQRITAVFE